MHTEEVVIFFINREISSFFRASNYVFSYVSIDHIQFRCNRGVHRTMRETVDNNLGKDSTREYKKRTKESFTPIRKRKWTNRRRNIRRKVLLVKILSNKRNKNWPCDRISMLRF